MNIVNRLYLAGGISDTARKSYQAQLAEKIEKMNFNVYAAARNDSINDKSNDPTPLDIYNADIDQVLISDAFIYTISGAGEDGTQFEAGVVSGANEERLRYNAIIDEVANEIEDSYLKEKLLQAKRKPIPILAFTTNERLIQPQFYKGALDNVIGLASAGYNHLILGGVDKWGVFAGTEQDMLQKLKTL